MIGATTTVRVAARTESGRNAEGAPIWTETLSEPLPANLFARSSSEFLDGKLVTVESWALRVPAGTALTPRDVIVAADESRFEVTAVRQRRSHTGAIFHVSADLQRVS